MKFTKKNFSIIIIITVIIAIISFYPLFQVCTDDYESTVMYQFDYSKEVEAKVKSASKDNRKTEIINDEIHYYYNIKVEYTINGILYSDSFYYVSSELSFSYDTMTIYVDSNNEITRLVTIDYTSTIFTTLFIICIYSVFVFGFLCIITLVIKSVNDYNPQKQNTYDNNDPFNFNNKKSNKSKDLKYDDPFNQKSCKYNIEKDDPFADFYKK